MLSRHRKPRDRYLDLLAREPLFRGVPRQLVVVLGRHVELLGLAPGAAVRCNPAREVMVVAEGQVLVTDDDGHAVGTIGPHGAIGSADRRASGPHRLVAATPARIVVIARPELGTVVAIAPAVADALAAATTRAERNAEPRATVGTRPS